jgi:hypothetical protein
MPPAVFEPTIPLSERQQTQALDRAATGISHSALVLYNNNNNNNNYYYYYYYYY